MFITGYCVEYSFPARIVQANYNINCTQFTVPCPTYYKSNEVYKCKNIFYPHFVKLIEKQILMFLSSRVEYFKMELCAVYNFIFAQQ